MIINLNRRGMLNVLFRQGRKFIAVLITGLFLATSYLYLTPPLYQAEGKLLVKFGRDAKPDTSRAGSPNSFSVNDHREIMQSNLDIFQSRDLQAQVLKEVGLAVVYPQTSASPSDTVMTLEEGAKKLSKNIAVKAGSQSNVINTYFFHPDPKIAAAVLDKYITLFIAKQVLAYSNPQTDFLRNQAEAAKQTLAHSDAELAQFKHVNDIANIDRELEYAIEHRFERNQLLANQQSRLLEADARRKSLQSVMSTLPKNRALPTDGEMFKAVDEAKERLAALQAKEQHMLMTYTEDSRAVVMLRNDIKIAEQEYKARNQQLAARTREIPNPIYDEALTNYALSNADFHSAAAPLKELNLQAKNIESYISKLEGHRTQLADLTRKVEVDDANYRAIIQKVQESELSNQMNESNISQIAVIDPVAVPVEPARPRKAVVVILAIVLSLALAIGVSLVAESFDDRFSLPEQVAFILNVPVLASFEYGNLSLTGGPINGSKGEQHV